MPDDLRDAIAAAIREQVRLRLGPNALAMAQCGEPVMLTPGEAQAAADAALGAIADAYIPPPPGSDRDKLPDHILAAVAMHGDPPPYVSTYCQTATALETAAARLPDQAGELREWADRQHRSCRLTRKQDMEPCLCGCGHPGRETTGPGGKGGAP